MRRLIIEEYKKLLKKKSVLVLTVLTMICTLGICYKQYFQYDTKQETGTLYNLEGEKVEKLELLKIRDQIMHQYAGVWNQEREAKIYHDLQVELKKYPRDQLDEKAMKKSFGKDWKKYLEKEKNKTLTEKELNDLINQGYYREWTILEDGTIELTKSYTNDAKRSYLSFIYTGVYNYHENYERDCFRAWNELLNNEKSLPTHFDSNLPNTRMLESLSFVYILPIFVIMIALANIFTIENECHTDQIIYPTKLNKRKITIAKLFVGYSLSIGLVWLQFIMVFIFGMIVFPVHSWNMVVIRMNFDVLLPLIPTTYFTLLMYAILIPTFAAIAIATFTMSLSYTLQRKFNVIIILFVYMIIGLILSQLGIGNLSHATHMNDWMYYFIQQLHPISMSMYHLYFDEGLWYHIGSPLVHINGLVIEMKNVVIIVWGAISVLVSIVITRLSKKQYIWK